MVGIETLCLAFQCEGGVVGFEKCPVVLKHEGWWSTPHPPSHQIMFGEVREPLHLAVRRNGGVVVNTLRLASHRNMRGLNGGGDSNRLSCVLTRQRDGGGCEHPLPHRNMRGSGGGGWTHPLARISSERGVVGGQGQVTSSLFVLVDKM